MITNDVYLPSAPWADLLIVSIVPARDFPLPGANGGNGSGVFNQEVGEHKVRLSIFATSNVLNVPHGEGPPIIRADVLNGMVVHDVLALEGGKRLRAEYLVG